MKNKYLIKEDLKILIEDANNSLEDLALKTNVSLRTLKNILSENEYPSNETINKIYSFAYTNGYRLNKIKEELLKEKSKNIILFHGAKQEIDTIKKNGSRDTCDFGKGFYLGETYLNAASFIYEIKDSSIYSFELNLKNLICVKFDCDLDWMILICYFRGMLDQYKNHEMIIKLLNKIEDADVIIAPIADNKMFNIMREFGEGYITSIEAIHSLASSGLGLQYVLKTDKAINNLKEIERLFLSSPERKSIEIFMDERSKEIDTKLKIAKRKFRGEGQYIDEIFV